MDLTITSSLWAGPAINVGTADSPRLPVVERRWHLCITDPALMRSLERLANSQCCPEHRLYDI